MQGAISMRRGWGVRVAITIFLALATMVVGLVPSLPAEADGVLGHRGQLALENRMTDALNAERAKAGLPTLTVVLQQVRESRRWSQSMADDLGAALSHDPNFHKTFWPQADMRVARENVGYTSRATRYGSFDDAVDAIHRALMNSEGHRKNILANDVQVVGVGVAWDANEDYLFVTQRFFGITGSPSRVRLFNDVSASQASNAEALWLAGVTFGCKDGRSFCPRSEVDRGEMAAFLRRASGLPYRDSGQEFADVPDRHLFHDDVQAIAAAGVTLGCSTNGSRTLYCPDLEVARQQMASFIVRAMQWDGVDKDWFRDAEGVHARDIQAMHEYGVTEGCGDRLYCPRADMSRSDMADFLVQGLKLPTNFRAYR